MRYDPRRATELGNNAYGRMVGPVVDRAGGIHPYDNRVTYNPYYVDPAADQSAAPQIIENPYVTGGPAATAEELDARGYGLATGAPVLLGDSGITATPAALPPELFVPQGRRNSPSGLPFPDAGLSTRGQQYVNQVALTEQQKGRNRAAQNQWGIITEKAAKEGWTPEQITKVSEQFQTQYGYANLPSPIALVETEEDESSPTVKLTRLKEKNPDIANFMQVTPEGKLEIIPGVVQWQANELKLKESKTGSAEAFVTEKRKAVMEEYNLEAEHVRALHGVDTLVPPDPNGTWLFSDYQAAKEDYQTRRKRYESDMAELQTKYFGAPPKQQGPQVTPQGQPATPANGRAAAAASGGVYHNSIDDTIRMVESGQLAPGTVVYYPDGRSITIPND